MPDFPPGAALGFRSIRNIANAMWRTQRQDQRSILSLYRGLIEIRNAHRALSIGSARVLGAARQRVVIRALL